MAEVRQNSFLETSSVLEGGITTVCNSNTLIRIGGYAVVHFDPGLCTL